MNDIVKHIAEHVLDAEALDPAIKLVAGLVTTGVEQVIGEQRVQNLRGVAARFAKKMKGKKYETPPLSVTLPLLEAARDESRDELQELWASLLATASDPARKRFYRNEFVDIAKRMEPIDAAVLEKLSEPGEMRPSRRQVIADRLQVTEDEVLLAFRNLATLDLVAPPPEQIVSPGHPYLGPLGRQFLKAVRG